jgi:DNA-directed RNA polymerase III subunit RPC6
MWAENDVGDNVSHDSSGTDSEGILKKSKTVGKKKTRGRGTTTSSEEEDEHPRKKPSKKPQSSRDRRRKRRRDSGDMSTSDSGGDRESIVKRRKRKKTHDDRNKDEDRDKSKRVSSISKRSAVKLGGRGNMSSEQDSLSEIDSSLSNSNSEGESTTAPTHSNQRRQSKRRARRLSPSLLASLDDKALGSPYVYRAVRQERVTLGWSEAPCGSCPVFDFCKEGGPVGPTGCEYYGEWLKRAAVTLDS